MSEDSVIQSDSLRSSQMDTVQDNFADDMTAIADAYLDNPHDTRYMDKLYRLSEASGIEGVALVRIFDAAVKVQRAWRAAAAARETTQIVRTW